MVQATPLLRFLAALLMLAVLVGGMVSCATYTKGQPIEQKGDGLEALVLLDFQKDFFEIQGRMPVDSIQGERAVQEANRAIALWQSAEKPIVYVVNAFPQEDRIANWVRKGAAVKGTAGADLITELEGPRQPVFEKSQSDAFANAAFDNFLREMGVTRLVLAGAFADRCVLATARGALQRGYRVSFLAGGVATTSESALAAATKKFQALGVAEFRVLAP